MKSSKSTKAKPAKEEECGIWLDTKELKEKKQQLSRPISRLVCFTQTKLNMPVTRQSVISSFFTHTHTDPNRSATHTETTHTETRTRTTHTGTTHTGNKRKHGMTSDSTRHTSEPDLQNRDGDCEGSSDKDQKELRFFHLIRGEESEDEEPPGKRRHVARYIHEYDQNVLNTQKHQNMEEKTGTQARDHNATVKGRVLTSRPVNHEATVKGRVLTSRPVNQILGRLSAESKTKASPMRRMGKENNGNNGPGSPNYGNNGPGSLINGNNGPGSLINGNNGPGSLINGNNGPGSPNKRQIVFSPAKGRLQEKHTLPSPEKCVSAGETLASLFTQDSEGVCVIAHRDQHSLEEHTHSSEDTSHGYSVCALVKEEEDEPEMLFTQDSEGNMVIKH